MSTWRGSDRERSAGRSLACAAGRPRPRLRPTSAGRAKARGRRTAREIAPLGAILAQEQCPVWRPSVPCILLGAVAWALVFVLLWALLAG
jgi:hypothetical protein